MVKKRISLILTAAVLLIFSMYIYNNAESFKSLTKVSIYLLVFIGLTKLTKFFFNGLFIQWTTEVFTKKFKLEESIYVAILSAVGNFFGPLFGGATIRAVYLKKVHNLSYSFFASTLTGYYVILFSIYSLLGVASLSFASRSNQSKSLLLFYICWFIFMTILMFSKLPERNKLKLLDSFRPTKYMVEVVYDIEKGWTMIVKQKKLLLRLVLLGVAGLAVTGFATYIEFRAIDVSLSMPALGLHTSLSATSILISITPGALGIKEGLLVLNSSIMNVTSEQVLQVAVIDRSITFIIIFILAIVSKGLKNKF
jgi:uncharacterized protein (TIRG00374 family)